MCTDLQACATKLITDLATLTGDDTMTSFSTCVSQCTALTCTKDTFPTCAKNLSCDSIPVFQTALNGCFEAAECHGGGGGGGGTGPYIAAIVLSMGDNSAPPFGFSEQVEVCTDSTCTTVITNATVKVNGTTLAWNSGRDSYEGTVSVNKGGTALLEVTVDGTTYSATGTQLTAAPVISAPTGGATWSHTSPNTISWSGGAPTTGSSYFVGVIDTSTGNFVFPVGDHGPQQVSIGTTSLNVPANSIASPVASAAVMVGIGNTGLNDHTSVGVAIPNAATGSGLWMGLVVTPLVGISVN